jgi:hypothetical protein
LLPLGTGAGKTQTWLPWPDIAHHPENTGLWFHDVLMADGRPYHEEEMALVQTLSKR